LNAFIYVIKMNKETLEGIRSLMSQKEEWQSESIIVQVENEDGTMTKEEGTPLTANLVDYIGRASSPRIPASQRGRKIYLANFDSDDEDYRRTKLIPYLMEASRPDGFYLRCKGYEKNRGLCLICRRGRVHKSSREEEGGNDEVPERKKIYNTVTERPVDSNDICHFGFTLHFDSDRK
jgi:hypothetical protein